MLVLQVPSSCKDVKNPSRSALSSLSKKTAQSERVWCCSLTNAQFLPQRLHLLCQCWIIGTSVASLVNLDMHFLRSNGNARSFNRKARFWDQSEYNLLRTSDWQPRMGRAIKQQTIMSSNGSLSIVLLFSPPPNPHRICLASHLWKSKCEIKTPLRMRMRTHQQQRHAHTINQAVGKNANNQPKHHRKADKALIFLLHHVSPWSSNEAKKSSAATKSEEKCSSSSPNIEH